MTRMTIEEYRALETKAVEAYATVYCHNYAEVAEATETVTVKVAEGFGAMAMTRDVFDKPGYDGIAARAGYNVAVIFAATK